MTCTLKVCIRGWKPARVDRDVVGQHEGFAVGIVIGFAVARGEQLQQLAGGRYLNRVTVSGKGRDGCEGKYQQSQNKTLEDGFKTNHVGPP